MKTEFSLVQLADPRIKEANDIFRSCVHCGFCTATCPTFVLLGDERDSPRGRIYLLKDMLEKGKPASITVARHIDRCLSCLSCMTTCPSGVHYMHLVDEGRARIEQTYKRPLADRLLREILARVLPNPRLFRLSLYGAWLARPFKGLLPGRLKGMVGMAPKAIPKASAVDKPQVFPAEGPRRLRVALLNGCAQPVLRPDINEATIRLLTRHGCEVVIAAGSGCCGALVHHMGREEEAKAKARANVRAWTREIEENGLDAVVINTSGCGTTVKDYGHMLRDDPELAQAAARIGAMTKDITELMAGIPLKVKPAARRPVVAYHAACSLQHGQQIREAPKQLLKDAGFEIREAAESHLCCGSAGTYNLLQPALATQLRDRKAANIEALGADMVAAGNLGCMVQISSGTDLPVVHTAELLDWATGGPEPKPLRR
ncbi:glycolate oxidase subunit GlcF [Shumkonia mesophila]|uniref:glycolate oxidase subunit GlcF n=1 Tax=Shumkonia mesophila TaxID=2838854 RepID=UPI002934F87F|nr:glycolate oxidase subunit GlcF [Shumkonia mesophila]